MTVSATKLQAALQAVLAGEHAASFGYSSVGVRLSNPAQVTQARTRQALHRQRRDDVRAELATLGATPVQPEAIYAPAEAVVDEVTAQRWALALETGCASAYRYLIAVTADSAIANLPTEAPSGAAGAAPLTANEVSRLRRLGLAQLIDASGAATQWRALLTPAAPSVPFPGA